MNDTIKKVTRLPTDDLTSIRPLSKEDFGRRLYEHMRAKGWNQSQLARYAGMGRDNVSQYVRGRSYPSPDNLAKLATALQIDPKELLPNYYEDAIEREAPQFEYREIPGDPDFCWLRINKRILKKYASQIIDLTNNEE